MYREISLRPIAVAIVLAATAIGSAEAGDEGYRGQYDRTYSAQAERSRGHSVPAFGFRAGPFREASFGKDLAPYRTTGSCAAISMGSAGIG